MKSKLSVGLPHLLAVVAAVEALKKMGRWTRSEGKLAPSPVIGFRGVTPGNFLKI